MTESVRNKILVCSQNGKEFVTKVLRSSQLAWKETEHYYSCEYSLETRYYCAKLEFVVPMQPSWSALSFHDQIGNQIDCLIIHFDASPDLFEEISGGWIPGFLEEYSPNLVIAATYGDVDMVEAKFRNWCIDNQIELVDLRAETQLPSSSDDDERGIVERMGFDRILEALEANMWENMEYKTDKRPVNPPIVSVSETTAPRVRETVALDPTTEEDIARLVKYLQGATKDTPATPSLHSDDFDAQHADDLDLAIQQFRNLRARASELPDEQRREMAAKVAMAFLNMLGDNEDDDDPIGF